MSAKDRKSTLKIIKIKIIIIIIRKTNGAHFKTRCVIITITIITIITTRLAIASVLRPFKVHLLKSTLPLEFPVIICDSHITKHKRPT